MIIYIRNGNMCSEVNILEAFRHIREKAKNSDLVQNVFVVLEVIFIIYYVLYFQYDGREIHYILQGIVDFITYSSLIFVGPILLIIAQMLFYNHKKGWGRNTMLICFLIPSIYISFYNVFLFIVFIIGME
ncbi:MAG: hypothetical protein GXZ08_04885 [Tissierellia bacterium]|nr:hypothetical protein [Tissierellia bacterium]